MKTFSINSTDDEIKQAIVEWSELLAEKKYTEAINYFSISSEELEWTAKELEKWIRNYGAPEPIDGEEPCEVTTLKGRDDFEDIFSNKMNVDRENLYGLDPEHYIGMVHYDDVPLNGFRSDLTARFHIMRVGEDKITLEFLDIHVM